MRNIFAIYRIMLVPHHFERLWRMRGDSLLTLEAMLANGVGCWRCTCEIRTSLSSLRTDRTWSGL